ncbi:MAG TPA: S-layer homology domain-containing protein, partial [Chloroflexia bacterium]|nr:S-layer homology domain-containing protein [Chloroflexia bacterium]
LITPRLAAGGLLLLAGLAATAWNAAFAREPGPARDTAGRSLAAVSSPGAWLRYPSAWSMHVELHQEAGDRPAPVPMVTPSFGSDVRVSQDNAGRPHNTFFGAANPLNPLHFISGANDYSANSVSGVYYTTDGGSTWGGGNLGGPYPGGIGIQPAGSPAGDMDALSPTQNTYFADLGSYPSNPCLGGVYVHRSTDGGVTFGPAVQAAASNNTRFLDREALAVDKGVTGAFAGRVYLGWTDFGGGSNCGNFTAATIKWQISTDHGVSWSAAGTLPQPVPAASSGTTIATVPGGAVYIGYNYWTSPGANNQRNYVSQSTDGGVTFGPYHATTTANLVFTGYTNGAGYQFLKADNAGHGFRMSQFPQIATSGNPNTVYMVWTHHQTGWDTSYTAPCCGGDTTVRTFQAADIAFARSTDGGSTWSAPLRLNDDALNNAKDQFMPALAVSPNGTMHVSWNDRRDDPNNLLYHTYVTQSTDGGLTWSANQRVSDQPSNPAHVLFSDFNGFLGDYNGLAANDTLILPLWCDARAGTPSGEQREYTDQGGMPAPTATPTAGGPTSTPGGASPTTSPTSTPPVSSPTTIATSTPGAAATSTPCPVQFTDVPPSDPFYAYIRCLVCRGIISGYADNTYRGGNNLTRGQAAKIVSNAAGLADTVPSTQQTFEDVPSSDAFWVFVERLAGRGYISGYACGAPPAGACVPPANRPYFLAYANITRGQISKVVANSAGLNTAIPSTQQTFADVPHGNAFWIFAERLAALNVISGYTCGGPGEPCDGQNRPYYRWTSNVTRNQAAKIVANTFFPGCQTPQR